MFFSGSHYVLSSSLDRHRASVKAGPCIVVEVEYLRRVAEAVHGYPGDVFRFASGNVAHSSQYRFQVTEYPLFAL